MNQHPHYTFQDFLSNITEFQARHAGDRWTVQDGNTTRASLAWTTTTVEADGILNWHVSIVYSEVWQCPSLYFRVFDHSGMPQFERISDLLSTIIMGATNQGLSSSVSLQEHPHLQKPYFQIHPCGVRFLLDELRASPQLTLVLFLSVMKNVTGLDFPTTGHSPNRQL